MAQIMHEIITITLWNYPTLSVRGLITLARWRCINRYKRKGHEIFVSFSAVYPHDAVVTRRTLFSLRGTSQTQANYVSYTTQYYLLFEKTNSCDHNNISLIIYHIKIYILLTRENTPLQKSKIQLFFIWWK